MLARLLTCGGRRFASMDSGVAADTAVSRGKRLAAFQNAAPWIFITGWDTRSRAYSRKSFSDSAFCIGSACSRAGRWFWRWIIKASLIRRWPGMHRIARFFSSPAGHCLTTGFGAGCCRNWTSFQSIRKGVTAAPSKHWSEFCAREKRRWFFPKARAHSTAICNQPSPVLVWWLQRRAPRWFRCASSERTKPGLAAAARSGFIPSPLSLGTRFFLAKRTSRVAEKRCIKG